MKQKKLLFVGVAVTALMMALLLVAVMFYIDNPDSVGGMVGMGMLSTGLMTFLVIFGVFYMKPPSDKDRYMELYQGICSNCGAKFGEDGVCPNCGRVGPKKN